MFVTRQGGGAFLNARTQIDQQTNTTGWDSQAMLWERLGLLALAIKNADTQRIHSPFRFDTHAN
jgi:hypothetical protein